MAVPTPPVLGTLREATVMAGLCRPPLLWTEEVVGFDERDLVVEVVGSLMVIGLEDWI